jgi:hypothetical protein
MVAGLSERQNWFNSLPFPFVPSPSAGWQNQQLRVNQGRGTYSQPFEHTSLDFARELGRGGHTVLIEVITWVGAFKGKSK